MSDLCEDSFKALLKLRDALTNTLKCYYCNNILEKARTLNCSHHVCAECAIQQSMNEGNCKHCNCNYFNKDITNNICINNIIETYNDLSMNIEKALTFFNIDASNLNDNDNDESLSENQDEIDNQTSINNRKRKRSSSTSPDHEFDENQENDNKLSNGPKAKKRKLSPEDTINELSHTPDSAMIDEMQRKTNRSLEIAKELNENDTYFIPSNICITGYDKDEISRFQSYATTLGIQLTKSWRNGTTDILISKTDSSNKPKVGFKVLASILCDVPIVTQNWLEKSYEDHKILDYRPYIGNYRRVGNNGLFEGLQILFATTNMPTERLRTLLSLGKADILETQQEIEDKDESKFNKRIMICAHDTESWQAKQLSKQYNCRVISESWVIKCICHDDGDDDNDNDDSDDSMEPIMTAVQLDEYDQTIKYDSDEDDYSDDDEDEDDSDQD